MNSRSSRQVLGAFGQPTLRLRQRQAHEQGVIARTRRGLFPTPPRSLKLALPDQEFALGGDPLTQLVPAPEDRLVRYLGVCLAAFRSRGHDQPVRMVRKIADQAPFLVGKFGTPRQPPSRLAILPYCRQFERQYPPKCVLSLGITGQNALARSASTPPSSIARAGRRNTPSPRLTICVHMSSSR